MATNIESTELDFARIKESLRTHFLSTNEFADYDFDASALDAILDVLAYNTHYNGLVANFALNESFLNTAQLRGSVLTIAESLGYTPRSASAAQAVVNLSITITDAGRPTNVTLPSNSQFNSSVDDVTYSFYTTEEYTGTDDGNGTYQFQTLTGSSDIPISEGTLKTKSFLVSSVDNPIYIIPDDNMDTTTAVVNVFRNRNSSIFDAYLPYSEAFSVSATSTFYGLREAPNGYYELYFGDGSIIGKKPAPGEFIVVTYLSTSSTAANNATSFTAQNNLTVGDDNYTVNVTTVTRSSGGAAEESIQSIKQNAPIQFSAQNRLVTAEDYIALVNANYGNYLDDVTAWGGEDNDPPTFGNVYVSLNYKSGTSSNVRTTVENNIVNDLAKNRSIMSIDTLFADAQTCFIETSTFFNFNPAKTSTTVSSIEAQVEQTVSDYFTTNLNEFNKIFRRSAILADVDDLSEAILNTRMDVKVQRRFTPTLLQSNPYNLVYPVALSLPLATEYVITSNLFTFNNVQCIIRNKLNSNILQVVAQATGLVLVNNIGTYTAATGKVNIVGFAPDNIIGGSNEIKISALPANQSTIRPLRNFILSLDTANSFSSAQLDYERIEVTL
jgi:hypothetical protein